MVQFARIDSQIRALRLIHANRFRVLERTESPYPLNLGGAISPHKFGRVECLEPLVLQCFLGPPP